jgi:hypothetical protein
MTESLHSVNNKYAIKGHIRSFDIYVMRKNIALLHWNNLKRIQISSPAQLDREEWPDDLTFRRDIVLKTIHYCKTSQL